MAAKVEAITGTSTSSSITRRELHHAGRSALHERLDSVIWHRAERTFYCTSASASG